MHLIVQRTHKWHWNFLVGQTDFKLWFKAVKMLFWSVNQEFNPLRSLQRTKYTEWDWCFIDCRNTLHFNQYISEYHAKVDFFFFFFFQNREDAEPPVRKDSHTGYGIFSLWFNELRVTVHSITMKNMSYPVWKYLPYRIPHPL